MEIVIKPSDEFCRQAKRFAKKYKSFVEDLTAFQRDLQQNPLLGVDLGGGRRKVRLNVSSKIKVSVEVCASLLIKWNNVIIFFIFFLSQFMTNLNAVMYQIDILIKL